MNLIIDTGNTATKIGVFDRNAELTLTETVEMLTNEKVNEVCQKYKIENCIHSFVAERDNIVTDRLSDLCNYIVFSHQSNIPITLDYQTPNTLGLDRIAGAIGANTIFPKNNVLVVDAGSAITIDCLTSAAQFIGGNISPGIQMRYKALNAYTDKLPLLDKTEEFNLLGRSTNEAIVSGVQCGILAEVEFYIEELMKKYSDLKVIITGGDTFFFETNLKKPIFAEPFLVLKGLNRIINYNV